MIQTSPKKPGGETFHSTWKEVLRKVNEGKRRNRAILFSGLALLVLLASPLTSLAATTPAKPAPKAVPKPAAKPAPKVAPKPPQKVAPKLAPKPIPKPAAKPSPTAKPVPKPTPAPQTKPSATTAPKVAPKPQAPAAKPSAPVPVKPATQTKPPVPVPTPPTKPQVPAKPPSPPTSVLPEANSSLLSIPTGQAPPAGTTVLLKHFGAVAQGKGLEMTETLYDFETMARRVAGEEWVKLSPAGQRYLVQLLMVFFKANMTLPGLGDMIRHVKFKSVTGGNLEGYTLIRYEQTFEGPYKGLVRDEQAGLLLTGQNNQYKIVDTEKEGKLLSRFLKESLAEIRKEKPETTLLAFVQEMVLNHAGNLVEMEGSLKQIKEQATANQAKPPGTSP